MIRILNKGCRIFHVHKLEGFVMLRFITLYNFFLAVGIVAVLLFIAKLIISYFVNKNKEVALTDEEKINFFSLESICAFGIGFGFIGYLFYTVFYMPVWMCFFAGIMFGLLFSCLYAFVLMNLSKLAQKRQESSENNTQE